MPCGSCRENIDENDPSISCDLCWNWFHLNCTNLNEIPPAADPWVCVRCRRRETLHALELEDRRQDAENMRNLVASQTELINTLIGNRDTQATSLRRQTLRKLPSFSGDDITQWPTFKAVYDQTTTEGRYDDVENCGRLLEHLTGAAKALVQVKLANPANLLEIMRSLEHHFGNPDKIYDKLIQNALNARSPRDGKPESLFDFSNRVSDLVCNLNIMNMQARLTDARLVNDFKRKLSLAQQEKWVDYARNRDATDLGIFNEFLESRSRVARELCYEESRTVAPRTRGNVHMHQEYESGDPGRQNKCPICADPSHQIELCPQFLDLNYEQKWEKVRAGRLCFGCLKRARHQLAQCFVAVTCGINGCNKKHHKLLHDIEAQQPENWRTGPRRGAEGSGSQQQSQQGRPNNPPWPHLPPGPSGQVAHHRENNAAPQRPGPPGSHPMFMIVPITAIANNKCVETFAFLDNGSAFTLVDASLAKELELTGTPEEFSMICAKESCITERNSIRTSFAISGRDSEKLFQLQDARTVENLGLPSGSLDPVELSRMYPHLKGLPMPKFRNAVPKILIGLNNATLLAYNRIVEYAQDAPIAVKTKLGWCIFGRQTTDKITEGLTFHLHSESEKDDDLHELVRSFFTTEHFGCKPVLNVDKSMEESRVQHIVDKTLTKIQGRYQVGLLWKDDEVQLPDSRPMALKRLKFVEARMNKDPELHSWYMQEIKSYIEKGYCRKLSPAEAAVPSPKTYYIPFFHVVNENKTPRKTRLVFDCAAKAGGRASLNSHLLTGPNVYVSMPGVIFKAREGKICVAADIKEMFPQIKIQPADQFAQRFLWRDGDVSKEPEVYVMSSMMFGACCSPYLAQLVKNHNALKFKNHHPEAVDAILTQHFVDDYLNSHHRAEDAIRIATEVIRIHKEAGFEIRNFVSNSPEVLRALPRAEEITKEIALSWEEDVTEKILGVHWNIVKDQFEVKLNPRKIHTEILTFQRPPTKRELLRITMSIFDPIGLLSHALIRPKVLIQETWRAGIGWDEYLPDVLFVKWKNWLESFLELAGLAIPRPYCRDMENVKEIQMHVLVDASESAFAAAVYFRMQLGNHVECVLVTSKSKVAPNKVLSVPRLELQAAVLGSRLAAYVRDEHRLKIDSQVFWSDSQTTLSWINCTDLQKLKPFVGVRVSEIHELSRAGEWRKVPTQMNVADDATKWSENTRYRADDRWFQGPAFLLEPESEWPTFAKQELPTPTELRSPVFIVASPEIRYDGIPMDRFSSYGKLVKVFAIMLKFIDCCSVRHDKGKLFTSYQQIGDKPKIVAAEACMMEIAEAMIVRCAQHEAFPAEYEALLAGKMLSRKSPLVPLNPTLDEMRVMRLGGRIRRVPDIADSSKFPAILPNKHHLTELIVQHYHEKFAHGFQESVLAATRHKFWIIHGRQAVRRIKTNCQRCKNKCAAPQPTLMGELPLCRLDWRAKSFFHTGMDLYGPLKAVTFRRTIKCYVMLFTCMVTRAIHLELVMSLNTDDSILCLRNFLNRRGPVAHFYCDNGTNWHGSHNELIRELQNCGPQLRRANDDYTIEWHFQPPSASHFGGAYERLIQSVQRAMESILSDRSPRLETLRSALIECENVINSRPLTHVPLEAEDGDPLTPNDLLKMHPNKMPPPGEFVPQDVNLRKQWRVAQQLANEFWVKWRQHYLPELARRTKWHQTAPAIKPDDIVLIVDGNLPRNEWRKGRVVRTIAGEDGLVRVAVVKHNNKEYTRPIMKLAKLDVQ